MSFDQNKHYKISMPTFVCCNEHQFTYICKKCEESMGCQFCAFSPDEKCDCS